jgi:hypothetical protein
MLSLCSWSFLVKKCDMPDKVKKHKHKSGREGGDYQIPIPGEVQRPSYEGIKEKNHGTTQHKHNTYDAQPANIFKNVQNKQAAVNQKPKTAVKQKPKKKGGKVLPRETAVTTNKSQLDGALRAHLERATQAFEDVGGGISYTHEATTLVSSPKLLEHVANSGTKAQIRTSDDDFDRLEGGLEAGQQIDVSGIVDQIAQESHTGNHVEGSRVKTRTFRSTLDAYSTQALAIVGVALVAFFGLVAIGTYLVVAGGKKSSIGYMLLAGDIAMAGTLYKCMANGTYWM